MSASICFPPSLPPQPITMARNVHSFSVTDVTFCRLEDAAAKGAGSKNRGKMAALSVSADRTCCATLVTKKRGECVMCGVVWCSVVWCVQ